jgi:hypothetical protein
MTRVYGCTRSAIDGWVIGIGIEAFRSDHLMKPYLFFRRR